MAVHNSDDEKYLTHGDECDRLAQMFGQARTLMALLREHNHRIVLANRAFQRLFGEKGGHRSDRRRDITR
jgi:PAS domain-containing protein